MSESVLVPVTVYGLVLFVLGGMIPALTIDLPPHVGAAVFLVIGEQINQGTILYGGIADHKGPRIFVVSALLDRLFETRHVAGRVVTYTAHLATAGVVGYLATGLRYVFRRKI